MESGRLKQENPLRPQVQVQPGQQSEISSPKRHILEPHPDLKSLNLGAPCVGPLSLMFETLRLRHSGHGHEDSPFPSHTPLCPCPPAAQRDLLTHQTRVQTRSSTGSAQLRGTRVFLCPRGHVDRLTHTQDRCMVLRVQSKMNLCKKSSFHNCDRLLAPRDSTGHMSTELALDARGPLFHASGTLRMNVPHSTGAHKPPRAHTPILSRTLSKAPTRISSWVGEHVG